MSEIDFERLCARLDKLYDDSVCLVWMNALTLAMLLYLLVKSFC